MVSRPDRRQPLHRAAVHARGGLPPLEGPRRPGDPDDPRRQGERAVAAVVHVVLPGREPRAAPRAAGVHRQVQGQVRRRLRGLPRVGAAADDREGHPARGHRADADEPDARRHVLAADDVRPWDSLSDDEKRLFARMAEVYAGFSEYTDHQVGRIVDYLEETGQLDNTIDLLLRRQRRLRRGHARTARSTRTSSSTAGPDEMEENLAHPRRPRQPDTYNHYPTGWAMAFSTPFRMFKRYSYQGGICDPLVDPLADGHQGARARCATSTTTRSTSSRRSSSAAGSSSRRR